jgi:hypothetical protein
MSQDGLGVETGSSSGSSQKMRVDAVDSGAAPAKLPWSAPMVTELPRLTELTLQSWIPGSGGTASGGSTVF